MALCFDMGRGLNIIIFSNILFDLKNQVKKRLGAGERTDKKLYIVFYFQRHHFSRIATKSTAMSNVLKFFKRINLFARIPTPYLKLIVSLYPGVAAVWLAFFKDPIVSSSRLARFYWQSIAGSEHYSINWMVTIYWILLIFWVICYFTFVTNESDANKKNTEGLKSAIFRSPNPKVFGEYETFYRGIMKQINAINKSQILQHGENLRLILKAICELTSSYINHKDQKIIYGANLMFYFPVKTQLQEIENFISKGHTQIHFEDKNVTKFNGVLYLVSELAYKEGSTNEPCPDIILPVIFGANEQEIALHNIPGAPRAALERKFLFADVRDGKSYEHLGHKETENARRYWTEIMPNVRSILSFEIPYDWKDSDIINVIGVLNIDSTHSNILGTDPEYHTTFFSLIYPIIFQVSPYIEEYYLQYVKELRKPKETAIVA